VAVQVALWGIRWVALAKGGVVEGLAVEPGHRWWGAPKSLGARGAEGGAPIMTRVEDDGLVVGAGWAVLLGVWDGAGPAFHEIIAADGVDFPHYDDFVHTWQLFLKRLCKQGKFDRLMKARLLAAR
jgi:hypothetical protein